MANIERNRQFITDHSPQMPDPGDIAKKLRHYLADNPLKLTSAAVLTGVVAAVCLRKASQKATATTAKQKIISSLIRWLIPTTGNPASCTEKGQPEAPFPLERRIIQTIRELFK